MNTINTNTLPAIVIVAFNRPKALRRLLKSVEAAKYDFTGIPLVISVDEGGGKEVVDIANSFDWKHGQKEVIAHSSNLGLREHVLQCGDLTGKYGSIIMLEEDCFVSANYYSYSQQALEYFKQDENIGGIALYSYRFNEHNWLSFSPVKDGYDNYFMQVPCSWGQAWTASQWKKFRTFYSMHKEFNAFLPENIKGWPETSWKKYFYDYLLSEDHFFVFPQVSFTTNFGDLGENTWKAHSKLQVQLDEREVNRYNFNSFSKSRNKFDSYFEILPGSIDLPAATCVDLYGLKNLELANCKTAFSIKPCSNPISSFGNDLFPSFLNLMLKTEGNEIAHGNINDFGTLTEEAKFKMAIKENEYVFNMGMKLQASKIASHKKENTSEGIARLKQKIKKLINAFPSL